MAGRFTHCMFHDPTLSLDDIAETSRRCWSSWIPEHGHVRRSESRSSRDRAGVVYVTRKLKHRSLGDEEIIIIIFLMIIINIGISISINLVRRAHYLERSIDLRPTVTP